MSSPTPAQAILRLLYGDAGERRDQTKLSVYERLVDEGISLGVAHLALNDLIARGLVEPAPTAPTGETQVRITDAGATVAQGHG